MIFKAFAEAPQSDISERTTNLQLPQLPSQPQLNPLPNMSMNRALLRASRATATASSRTVAPRAAFTSQIRNYATPGAADSKPPVALYGLDGTYAFCLGRSPISDGCRRGTRGVQLGHQTPPRRREVELNKRLINNSTQQQSNPPP